MGLWTAMRARCFRNIGGGLRLSSLVLLLWTILFTPPALAQMGGGDVQAWLTGITVVEDTEGRTVLKLQLAPHLNSHVAATDASGVPAIAFTLASRGQQLAVPTAFTGPVKAIRVEENPGFLFVRFDTKAPGLQISSHDNPDNSVSVTIADPRVRPSAVSTNTSGAMPSPIGGTGSAPPSPAIDYSAMGFELVMLEYADVSEVAGLLADNVTIKPNDTFVPRSPGFGSANTNGMSSSSYNPGPQAQNGDSESLGRSISPGIGVDRRLNAIWLRGDPDTIKRLKAQIAAIDQPIDTVMLETQIVELTESGARNIGLDLANANGQIASGSGTYGNITSSSTYPLTTYQLNGSVTLQAAVYAQVQHGEGRILSRPRVAAQSGASARIVTGDAIPILTSITLSGVNGVSQQVQYVNVGVTLQIAPRVTRDGIVSSHIYCVVSSVTGYLQGYPTISQREAETFATVRDGESFVIGGLSQDSSLKTRSRLPILGDIPILSALAGVSKFSKQKTELYIMVTPHVIRHLNLKTAGGRDQLPPGVIAPENP